MSVTILVRHEVRDFDNWKAVFDSAVAMRQAGGEIAAQVFRDIDNPNIVTIINTWDSLENAQAFLGNPDLRNAMEQGGVIGEPHMHFMNNA